jgi:hypothetical protein
MKGKLKAGCCLDFGGLIWGQGKFRKYDRKLCVDRRDSLHIKGTRPSTQAVHSLPGR